MNIKVKHLGDVQFSIESRGHTLYCDQPQDSGGYDEAMTPPEIFLGALGACAAFYAVAHLKRHNLPFDGTTVEALAEKLKSPARLGEIVLRVASPAALNETQQLSLGQSVARCILHNTLTHPPVITTEIVSQPSPELVAA